MVLVFICLCAGVSVLWLFAFLLGYLPALCGQKNCKVRFQYVQTPNKPRGQSGERNTNSKESVPRKTETSGQFQSFPRFIFCFSGLHCGGDRSRRNQRFLLHSVGILGRWRADGSYPLNGLTARIND